MRAKLPAVVVAAAAVAAVLGAAFGSPPSWLGSLLTFLAAWTVVSVFATACFVLWLRSGARAGEALPTARARAEWKGGLAAR